MEIRDEVVAAHAMGPPIPMMQRSDHPKRGGKTAKREGKTAKRGWHQALPVALLLFGASRLAAPASAQVVSFGVQFAPSVVANTGLSEVLGDIILIATAACGTNTDKLCVSTGSTIQVRFTNVTIDNSVATGIQVCETISGVYQCNIPGNFLTGNFTVSNDTLSFGVRENIDIAASDRILIAGVRARIASSVLVTPGIDANAVLSATPASAATFPPDTLVVAQSADPLNLRIFSVPEIPCAVDDAIPSALIVEGYTSAFVDYGDPVERSFPGPPVLARPIFGGNANTRISVTVSGMVPGVQVQWPRTVPAVNSAAVLDLISTSADGATATYVYGTLNQLADDQITETFAIRLNPINFTFSGTGVLSGIVRMQTQLLPAAVPDTLRPRFNHPLEPVSGEPFFLLKRCTPSTTTVGRALIHATADSLAWTGTLNYQLQGPALFNGTKTPDTINGLPTGTYQATYLSGGPAGATFTGISPSNAQSLTSSGTIDFSFDFTGPTIANLQFSSSPLPVCPTSTTPVGSFQLVNATTDTQIIPSHTGIIITFSKLLVTPPTVSGIGNAQSFVGAADVTYTLPDAIILPPGGVISFSGAVLNLNGLSNGQNVTVLATIAPPEAVQLNTNQVTLATASAAQCVPVVSLAVQPSSITRGQSATLSWASQFVTTLNLQPGIGVVQPQGSVSVAPTNTTTYTLTGQGPGGSAQATAQLTVNDPPPPPPVFSSTGVTNGASFAPGLTAGGITTLFGTRLSNVSGIQLANTLPLPTQISGTSVTVNAILAPLFAVANANGQEQINFQVPWEVAPQSAVNIVVSNNGVLSDPVSVTLQPALPGIFTTDGTAGAILHGIGSALVTQANPASGNETVVVFATGLGAVINTPATGTAALSSPQSLTTTTPVVTIGGVQGRVDFSGLAPGFVGLYQLNVVVPANAPSGTQDVVIQVGNQASRPAKIAIR